MICIVDISEVENDGEYGVFVITLECDGVYSPVLICYSLAEHRLEVTGVQLDGMFKSELRNNVDLLEELREAVMAERDARSDATESKERADAAESKKIIQAELVKKWERN